MAGVRICAVCGKTIGPPDGRDDVSVIRHVTLTNGRTGWVALHVRCSGLPLPSATERAEAMPPGKCLALPDLTA